MPRLLEALKKKPDISLVTSKIVAEKFGEEIAKRNNESVTAIAKRLNDVVGEMWDECKTMIKAEVARQMPAPQILERPPQIIREIVKEVQKETQDAVRREEGKEEETEREITFSRNQEGFVVSIQKGDKTYLVKRDKQGFIKRLVAK